MRTLRLFYRLLLLTWPRATRVEQDRELEEMFLYCVEAARSRGGRRAVLAAAARGAADALVSAVAAHRLERRRRSIERLSGTLPRNEGSMRTLTGMILGMFGDARFALRTLGRERTFTVTALLTLIICIGGNTAIFSIVRSVLLKPLPIDHPDRIVLLANVYPKAGATLVAPDQPSAAEPDYFDRLREIQSFDAQALYRRNNMTLGLPDGAERISALRATASFYSLVGARQHLGRSFGAEDEEIGKDATAILSYRFWQRQYGADPSAVGQDLRLNGTAYRIVGIMRSDFEYLWNDIDVWLPLAFAPQQRSDALRHSNNWMMIARLKPGVSIETAQSEIDALNARNAARFPQMAPLLRDAGFRTIVVSLHDALVRDVRPSLLLLWGGAFFVLLVGIVNLANLFLVRAARRHRELATRAAIGASAVRIGRQILTETTVLALAGGVVGIALGWSLLRSLSALHLELLPLGHQVGVDWQAAALMVVLAVLVGILIGIAPSIRTRHINLGDMLRDAGRSGTAGAAANRTRRMLATVQVALAFTLLFGAALLLASFRAIVRTDTGFQPGGVITARLLLPSTSYRDNASLAAVTERMLTAIRALPGVSTASVTTTIPFGGNYNNSVILAEGVEVKPGQSLVAPLQIFASAGYFETMRIPLTSGRYFDSRDTAGSNLTAIVDERLAQKFWPGQNPLGRRLYRASDLKNPLARGPNTPYMTVVGVVKEVQTRGLAAKEPPVGAYYFPVAQQPVRGLVFAIRGQVDPESLVDPVRKAIASIDRELPLFDVLTMDARLDQSLVPRRMPMILALAYGVVGLFLATIGVYGVLAYQVAQRTREIGIRIALGSTTREVVRLVFREGAWITAAGLLLGLAGTFVVGRAASGLLYGVTARDPMIIVTIAAILAGAALAATLIPAHRAASVNPVDALNE